MPPDTPELLPARVWLARRAVDKNNQRLPDATFKQVLAETFIPATVQWMHHFGLTTYIPSLWPLPAVDSPNTRPDETALVLYKSVEEYEKAAKTPTGRLYFKAHSLAFDTGLNKNFPSRYSPKTGSNLGAPYFGGTGALDDWSQHPVHVVALHHATPATATDWVDTFVQPRLQAISGLRQWVAWSSTDWLVLWLCADGGLPQFDADLPGQPHWRNSAQDTTVPPDPATTFTGVALEFGQTLRIRA